MKKCMMPDLIHHQIICTRIILNDTSVMIPMRFSMVWDLVVVFLEEGLKLNIFSLAKLMRKNFAEEAFFMMRIFG